MSIKNKLLEEIDKKAQKIRDKRASAANNKSLEDAVFDFFRNIEECRKLHNNERYDTTLFHKATAALKERVQGFDRGTKISVEWNVSEDVMDHRPWEEQQVRGVTIWWSQRYIRINQVDPSMYIDLSSMLFF